MFGEVLFDHMTPSWKTRNLFNLNDVEAQAVVVISFAVLFAIILSFLLFIGLPFILSLCFFLIGCFHVDTNDTIDRNH